MDILIDAYLDNNIGDDLMIKLLANRFPEHRFFLYSGMSAVAHTFKAVANITVRPPGALKQDMETAKVYLSVGGSIFQAFSRRQKLWRAKRLIRFRRIRRHGLAVATLGANLGPFSGWLGPKLIAWELRKNDLVAVRDKEAYDLLQEFGKIKDFCLVDDIVYNLEKTVIPGQEEKRGGLGISAYRSLQKWETNIENYRFLARLADAYIRERGRGVTLFAFDTERENDLTAAHHILNFAQEKQMISIVPYLGDEKPFLEAFRACERIVAIRFHAAVLADIFEIPFLPVSYSNKMENLLSDRGYTGLSYRLDELNSSADADQLAGDLIDGGRLFSVFMRDRHNAEIHFEALARLLSTLEDSDPGKE